MAAGAPSLVAPPAAHGGFDDATIAFLLEHSLAEKLQEEEVKEVDANLAAQEQRLVKLVHELRSEGPRQLSRLEMAVVYWFQIKQDVLIKKGEKRKRGGRGGRSLGPCSAACHDVSLILSSLRSVVLEPLVSVSGSLVLCRGVV